VTRDPGNLKARYRHGVERGLLGAVKVGVAFVVEFRQRIFRGDPVAPVTFHLGEVAEQAER
jgi:hypothetical protein